MPSPSQTASRIRRVLRDAGPMVRVEVAWIARCLGLTAEQVLAGTDRVETATFRVMRIGAVGATLAWA